MARVNAESIIDTLRSKLEQAFEDTVRGKLAEGENAGYLSSDFVKTIRSRVDRWISVSDLDVEKGE